MSNASRPRQGTLFEGVQAESTPPREPGMVECRAIECTALIEPRMLMCRRHWRRLPARLRNEVWATYRDGQDFTTASPEYFLAAAEAVEFLADAEGLPRANWFRRVYEEMTGPR